MLYAVRILLLYYTILLHVLLLSSLLFVVVVHNYLYYVSLLLLLLYLLLLFIIIIFFFFFYYTSFFFFYIIFFSSCFFFFFSSLSSFFLLDWAVNCSRVQSHSCGASRYTIYERRGRLRVGIFTFYPLQVATILRIGERETCHVGAQSPPRAAGREIIERKMFPTVKAATPRKSDVGCK